MDTQSIVELVHGLIPWARIPAEIVACLLLAEAAMRICSRVAGQVAKAVDHLLGRSGRRSVRKSFEAWGTLLGLVGVVVLLIVCAL